MKAVMDPIDNKIVRCSKLIFCFMATNTNPPIVAK